MALPKLVTLITLGLVAASNGAFLKDGAGPVIIGDWTVSMTPDCIINVSHPLNQQAWVSDQEIIQVGTGNVDVVNIIKNGDIQNFPAAFTYSSGLTCQQVQSSIGGFKVQGTVNVPSNTT